LPAAARIASWKRSFASIQPKSAPSGRDGDGVAEQALGLFEAPQLGLAGAGGSDLGRESLELGADRVSLADLPCREAPHYRAAVWNQHHRSRRVQHPQRFANRRAADSELGRQVLLTQPRPGGPRPREDLRVNLLGKVVDEALVPSVPAHIKPAKHRGEVYPDG
jgi:hypothetical protein